MSNRPVSDKIDEILHILKGKQHENISEEWIDLIEYCKKEGIEPDILLESIIKLNEIMDKASNRRNHRGI
jgi:hypothetical protein